MRKFAFPLAGVALATASAAAAQATSPQALALPHDPPGVNRLSISGTGEVIYDTNVAKSDQAIAALRGLSLADVSYRPSMTLDILRALGNQSVFLNGSAGYDFYQHNTLLNSSRIDIAGGAELRFGPCHSVVSDEYARQQTDLQDVTIAVAKNEETLNSINFYGDCARTIGLTPTLNLSQSWASNSNSLLKPQDYNSLFVQAGLAYQRPVFGKLSLFGRYSNTSYPRSMVPVGAGFDRQGYRLYAGGVRFERQLGARIDGSVEISYTDLEPYIAAAPKFRGLTYVGTLTLHPTSRITATVNAERDTKPSIQPGSSYSTDDNDRVELDYAINPRWKIDAGVSYLAQRYGGAALNPKLDLLSQRITDYYAGAELDFARRFSLIFDAREENRRASLAGFSYAATRVSLTLAARL